MLPGCSVLKHFLPRKEVKVANTSLDLSCKYPKRVPPFPGGGRGLQARQPCTCPFVPPANPKQLLKGFCPLCAIEVRW